MSDIKIEIAPKTYQKYLKIGDKNGNQNGVIDERDEALAAADALCKERIAIDCQNFLNYLENRDYSFPHYKEELLANSLLKDLKNDDIAIRNIAASKLKIFAKANLMLSLKTKIAEALITLLTDPEEKVRINSLRNLSDYLELDIPPSLKSKAVEPILKLLKKNAFYIKVSALHALAILSDAKTKIPVAYKNKMVQPILDTLEVRNDEIRIAAINVLEILSGNNLSIENEEKIFETLLKKTGDSNLEFRNNVLTILSDFAFKRISLESKIKLIDPMILALSQDNKNAKENAALALVELAQINASAEIRLKLLDPLVRIIFFGFTGDFWTRSKKALLMIITSIFSDSSRYDLKLKTTDSLLKLIDIRDDELEEAALKSLISLLKVDPPVEVKNKIFDGCLKVLRDSRKEAKLWSLRGTLMTKLLALQALPDLINSDLPFEAKSWAFEPLLSILKSNDAGIKKLTLKSLGMLASLYINKEQKAKLVNPLLECLKNPEEEVRKQTSAILAYLAQSDLPDAEKEKMVNPLFASMQDSSLEVKKNVSAALWNLSSSNLSKEAKIKLIDNFGQRFRVGDHRITAINFNLFDPDNSSIPIAFEKMVREYFMKKYQITDREATIKLSIQLNELAHKLNLGETSTLSPRNVIVFIATITNLIIYGDKPGRKFQDDSLMGRAKSIAETIKTGRGVCHDYTELFMYIFNILREINKNTKNVYAQYIGGRISGYGTEHAWVMLVEVKGSNEFLVTYIDPTWAKKGEKEDAKSTARAIENSLNAFDRTHFHMGRKIDLQALFSDKKQARKLALEFLKANKGKEQTQILNEMAYIYRHILNDNKTAIKYYRLAIEKYSPNKENEKSEKDALLEALYYLGEVFSDTYKNQEALEIFKRFLKEFPNDFSTPYVLLKKAEIYKRQRLYQQAIDAYQKIITDFPNHIKADDAYFELGSIYLNYKIISNRNEAAQKACAIFREGTDKYPNGDRINDLRERIQRCPKIKIREE